MSSARKRANIVDSDDDEVLWGSDQEQEQDTTSTHNNNDNNDTTSNTRQQPPKKKAKQQQQQQQQQSSESLSESEYDEEGYGDDEDRAKLESMTQLEREDILYQRAEKRRERDERREAQRRAHQVSSGGSSLPPPSSKRTTRSSSSRPSAALADLVARKHRVNTSKPSESIHFDGDDDDERNDEEDDEYDESVEEPSERQRRKRKSQQARRSRSAKQDDEEAEDEALAAADAENADDATQLTAEEQEKLKQAQRFSIPGSHTPLRLSDMRLIQLRRDRLERVFEEPYFSSVVEGMFIRVTVGLDKNNQPKYRAGEVVKVEDMHKYVFPTGSGRQTKTGLLLRRGKHQRVFAMAAVSNHSITEEEFTDYITVMKADGLPVLTAEDALERKKKAEHLRESYEYTPDVVAKMIEEKEKKGRSRGQINLTLERTKLELEIARAKAKLEEDKQKLKKAQQQKRDGKRTQKKEQDLSEDDEEAANEDQLTAQLIADIAALEASLPTDESRVDTLETRLSELRELEVKQRNVSRQRSELHTIAQVNARNKEQDIHEMRDMFKQMEMEKKREEEERKKNGQTKKEVALNPFQRRATRPSMNWEEEEEKKEEDQRDKQQLQPLPGHAQQQQQHSSNGETAVAGSDWESELKTATDSLPSLSPSVSVPSPLSLPHPPSSSESALNQLRNEHEQVNIKIDLSALSNPPPPTVQPQSLPPGNQSWIKYTVLPPNANVLTVAEYWARREDVM